MRENCNCHIKSTLIKYFERFDMHNSKPMSTLLAHSSYRGGGGGGTIQVTCFFNLVQLEA
jgi:hypothetical protein